MSLTNEPLTDAQKVLPSGAVFPSGESNYYDWAQNRASGINADFPSPSDFTHESGTIRTYGPDGNPVDTSGIFAFDGEESRFSNAKTIDTYVINDYTAFNAYIHYTTGVAGNAIQIPYISTSTVAATLNPYPF